jgi:hypothetical protein
MRLKWTGRENMDGKGYEGRRQQAIAITGLTVE